MKKMSLTGKKSTIAAGVMVLAAVLAAGVLLTGCGKKKDAGGDVEFSAVGEFPVTKTKLSMTMFAMSAPNVIDMQTNDFTKYLEDKTNIHWDFVTAPNESSTEKINLLLSSNDYPDAFMFKTPDVSTYGMKEHILIPLEDLIPQYMPNYWAFMQANPGLWAQQRQADGHIYAVASFNECYHCLFFNKMWVNTEWLDKIGLGWPQTTEELKAVCKRFLELNPNGIAITGSTTGWGEQFTDFLLGSFITNPGDRTFGDKLLVSPTGQIVTAANQREYREFLRFMNDLYKMGAIYDGGFTQNPDQLRALVNQPGAPVLFFASGANVNQIDADVNPDLYRQYRVTPPFAGPDGTRIATEFKYNDLQENKLVISDKAKYPEAILRWADHFYMLQGYLEYQYGANLDGKDFVLNPAGEAGLNGRPALFRVINQYTAEPQNHDWQDVGLIYATADIRLGESTNQDIDIFSSAGLEKLLYVETAEKCEPYAQKLGQFDVIPNRLKLTADEANSVATVAVELDKYIDENMVAFIQGRRNIETDWDAYLAGFDRIGLPDYLKVHQAAWDRSQGK